LHAMHDRQSGRSRINAVMIASVSGMRAPPPDYDGWRTLAPSELAPSGGRRTGPHDAVALPACRAPAECQAHALVRTACQIRGAQRHVQCRESQRLPEAFVAVRTIGIVLEKRHDLLALRPHRGPRHSLPDPPSKGDAGERGDSMDLRG